MNAYDRWIEQHNTPERLTQLAERSFEVGKITFLLKLFGLHTPKIRQELRDLSLALLGVDELTGNAFNTRFPEFPLKLICSRLGGQQLHLVKTALLPALFRQFSDAPFSRFFETVFEQTDADHPVGLVFPRKGIKHGMVMYTVDDLQYLPFCKQETVLTHVSGNKKHRQWIVLRTFQKTVEGLYNKGHGLRLA